MPELPEVAMYDRFVRSTSLDKTIIHIEIEDERLVTCGQDALRSALLKQSFTDTTRIGKFLFLHTSADQVVKLHFGMTGRPAYFTDVEAAPRFTRVRFAFADGSHFGFVNMRKFGRIDVAESVASYQAAKKLGSDALDISEEAFVKALHGRKTTLKAALLQQKHFAGIGNWIADEIMFQARLRADVGLRQLSESELMGVYDVMQHVLRTAVDLEADHDRFPAHFMVPHRWGDGLCPETGEALQKTTVAGRATYYSLGVQGPLVE